MSSTFHQLKLIVRSVCLTQWGRSGWAILVWCLGTGLVHATTIYTTTTQVGLDRWETALRIDAGTTTLIEELTVYFDHNAYANLHLIAAPAGWDVLMVQPDNALAAAGFLDALALNEGLHAGQVLSGFVVGFNYLGSGRPGGFQFDVIDPLTFEPVESGITISASAVPEPGTLQLSLLGLLLCAVCLARRSSAAVTSFKVLP